MINSLFSRLVDYKFGTTELAPSLADSWTVSPDGLVYTFKLNPKAKFTNGRKVTAADVKYSIERAVNPKTQGPGGGFFHSIVGQDKMADGSATTISGIEAVDDSTIKFTLSQPDATFLNVLALNFASAVPKEVVEAEGADFGKKPVGSGGFKLDEWVSGQRLVFSRNPDYFRDRPNLDGFKVEIGQEPLVAILRLQKGEVDIAGDGIPPAKYLEMKNSPDAKDMIVDRDQLETSYVTINTTKKPLDDVRVRKAINMAINKDRIVRIINGRATPADQVLPPLMPGYDKAYKGYPYDVEGAKKLMAEAGLKDGFSTTLYAMNTDPNPRIAQAIQQDLAAIGIKAEIKALAQPEVIAAGGNKDESAADLVGRHGLDRRLPRSVRLLRSDPRLRRRGGGRMELVVVLRQELRGPRDQGRRHVEARAEGRAVQGLGADLHRHPGAAGALGARVQRAPRRRQVEAHGRTGRDLHRSDPRHRLRGDLHQALSPIAEPGAPHGQRRGAGRREASTLPLLAFAALRG